MDIGRRDFRTLVLVGLVVGASLLSVGMGVAAADAPTQDTTASHTPTDRRTAIGATDTIDAQDPPVAPPTVPTNGSVTLSSDTGPTVVVVNDGANVSLNNSFGSGSIVDVTTERGNATFSGAGRATINTTNITGTFTNVTNLDVDGGGILYIEAEGKRRIGVFGDTDRLAYRDVTPDDGAVDFEYAGASGYSEIYVFGLANDTAYDAVDSDGAVLDTATTNSTGATAFVMPNSDHEVKIKKSTTASGLQLSDPSPSGAQTAPPSEYAVNITHNDFPNENVTLRFYHEGSEFYNETVTSAGRVNTTNTPTLSGSTHEWSVVAEDDAGETDVINATFTTAGALEIRDEENPDQLLNDNISISVKFVNGTLVTARTTTTGTIDLTTLPDTDFIVTARANRSYYQRTEYFADSVGTKRMFMLNNSTNSVESRFVLEDPTGQFGSQSVVIVKRAINLSGTEKYRTIYSDKFGTEGVTADLEEDVRYLIYVRNPETGVTQEVGPYRSDVSETVTVRPGTPTIDVESYENGWGTASELNNQTLEVLYEDPTNETTELTIWIHERGNKSNQLRQNTTVFDAGTFAASYGLTKNESEKQWVVNYVATRNSETRVVQDTVMNNPDLVPELSSEWRLIVAILMLLISAGVFSVLNAGVGGVVVAIEGGVLWWSGWLDGATTGIAVVLALFVAIIFHVYQSGRGL